MPSHFANVSHSIHIVIEREGDILKGTISVTPILCVNTMLRGDYNVINGGSARE